MYIMSRYIVKAMYLKNETDLQFGMDAIPFYHNVTIAYLLLT
jgi:hypothetical protein